MITRRNMIKGATLSLGAATLLQTALTPNVAKSQGDVPPGTTYSFVKGGVRFHTYVSPAAAVSVTSHIVEFQDQLLLVDATFMPPTAQEVSALIASTNKPVAKAILSHEHPDHWGGAAAIEGVTFDTLPEIREGMRAEAEGGKFGTPTNVLNGGDVTPGLTEISGVPVEFRHYRDNEAPHMLVTVLPDQQVAIVQDLVYNGVFFAPGVDRGNWIATLEMMRDDPAFETLLVGHGMPTSRGDLDNAIAYVRVLDDAMTNAATPDEAIEQIKAAYPGYSGDFLLTLIKEYWVR